MWSTVAQESCSAYPASGLLGHQSSDGTESRHGTVIDGASGIALNPELQGAQKTAT
jgi:hypothetical protein